MHNKNIDVSYSYFTFFLLLAKNDKIWDTVDVNMFDQNIYI